MEISSDSNNYCPYLTIDNSSRDHLFARGGVAQMAVSTVTETLAVSLQLVLTTIAQFVLAASAIIW